MNQAAIPPSPKVWERIESGMASPHTGKSLPGRLWWLFFAFFGLSLIALSYHLLPPHDGPHQLSAPLPHASHSAAPAFTEAAPIRKDTLARQIPEAVPSGSSAPSSHSQATVSPNPLNNKPGAAPQVIAAENVAQRSDKNLLPFSGAGRNAPSEGSAPEESTETTLEIQVIENGGHDPISFFDIRIDSVLQAKAAPLALRDLRLPGKPLRQLPGYPSTEPRWHLHLDAAPVLASLGQPGIQHFSFNQDQAPDTPGALLDPDGTYQQVLTHHHGGFLVNLQIRYDWGKRWSLSSGWSFYRSGMHSLQESLGPPRDVQVALNSLNPQTFRTQFWELPLLVSYRHRMGPGTWHLSGGISYASAQGPWDPTRDPDYVSEENRTPVFNTTLQLPALKQHRESWHGQLSLGYEWPLSQRWSLHSRLSFQQSLSPVHALGSESFYLKRWSWQNGLGFHLNP